ncbi:hypothetical protein DMUE_5130 [Dictyocoela muelleri]|nr:hypothetical protein DMUE_5130 [Dictyocoela muelleri]
MKTVRRIIISISELLKDYQDNIIIGCDNSVIIIDESKFGKRKYNRGRLIKGAWVLGMLERGSNKIILYNVCNRKSNTSLPLILRHFIEGSIIHTDNWRAYPELENKYVHRMVNHSLNFVDPIKGVHTNTIERFWADIKCLIPKRYRDERLIQNFLNLYFFIRNEKTDLLKKLIFMTK